MKRAFAILAVAVLSMLLGMSVEILRRDSTSLVSSMPSAIFGGEYDE